MRRIALLLSPLAIGLVAASCSDDKSPAEEARDDVCEARGDLREEMSDLADDVRAGNLGDAADEVADIRETATELSTSVSALTDEQRAAVQPQVDAISTTVSSLTVSDLGNIEATIDDLSSQVNEALDVIGGTSGLDC